MRTRRPNMKFLYEFLWKSLVRCTLRASLPESLSGESAVRVSPGVSSASFSDERAGAHVPPARIRECGGRCTPEDPFDNPDKMYYDGRIGQHHDHRTLKDPPTRVALQVLFRLVMGWWVWVSAGLPAAAGRSPHPPASSRARRRQPHVGPSASGVARTHISVTLDQDHVRPRFHLRPGWVSRRRTPVAVLSHPRTGRIHGSHDSCVRLVRPMCP